MSRPSTPDYLFTLSAHRCSICHYHSSTPPSGKVGFSAIQILMHEANDTYRLSRHLLITPLLSPPRVTYLKAYMPAILLSRLKQSAYGRAAISTADGLPAFSRRPIPRQAALHLPPPASASANAQPYYHATRCFTCQHFLQMPCL